MSQQVTVSKIPASYVIHISKGTFSATVGYQNIFAFEKRELNKAEEHFGKTIVKESNSEVVLNTVSTASSGENGFIVLKRTFCIGLSALDT